MLLTNQNLAGITDGIGVASVCSKIINSELFKIRLIKKANRSRYLPLINDKNTVADLVIQKLTTQCSSEQVAQSLQRGLDYGSSFRADWVVGNKHMKRQLHDIHETIASNQPELLTKKDKIVTELRDSILSAFQESAPYVISELSDISFISRPELLQLIANTYRYLHMLETKQGKLRFLYERSGSITIQRHLPKIAKIISRLPDPPAYVKRISERQVIGQRFKKRLLYFLADMMFDGGTVEVAEKVASFFSKLFGSPDIELYWRKEYDNDEQIIRSVWFACHTGQVRLQVVTCPDYSGYIDSSGVWNFDFLELGTGVGVVAQKSFKLTELIYKLLTQADVRVELVHHLPFFEFKDGFCGKETLSLEGVRGKLKQSLAAIADQYESMGIKAEMNTSEATLSNEKFFEFATSAKPTLQKLLPTRHPFPQFFEETLKKRASIYRKWYPPNGENEETYALMLQDKLWEQLAEYYTETSLLNNGRTIMVFADSPQMSQAYSFFLIPAFCGHGTGSLQYAG